MHFHASDAIVMQSIVDEQLVQGLYVAARAGSEPATFKMQGTEPTTEPPHPIMFQRGM